MEILSTKIPFSQPKAQISAQLSKFETETVKLG